MNEMIERVAIKIGKQAQRWSYQLPHPLCQILARSVLEAMREPTAEMLFVGSNDEAGFTQRNLLDSWHLMIDEALASSPLSSNRLGGE